MAAPLEAVLGTILHRDTRTPPLALAAPASEYMDAPGLRAG